MSLTGSFTVYSVIDNHSRFLMGPGPGALCFVNLTSMGYINNDLGQPRLINPMYPTHPFGRSVR
eukprot:1074309-Amphidinium_carterae.2